MDVLQSLSGLLLVVFVWSHMFFESSILLGKDAMYQVTRMFEGVPLFGRPYPLLVSFVAVVVFLLVAVHAILALRKAPGSHRQYALLHRHMGTIAHPDTTLWYVQVITGFCLFFLVSIVLLSIPGSCSDCQTCLLLDDFGNVIGESKFCGDDLEAALDRPDIYDCR